MMYRAIDDREEVHRNVRTMAEIWLQEAIPVDMLCVHGPADRLEEQRKTKIQLAPAKRAFSAQKYEYVPVVSQQTSLVQCCMYHSQLERIAESVH